MFPGPVAGFNVERAALNELVDGCGLFVGWDGKTDMRRFRSDCEFDMVFVCVSCQFVVS